MVQTSLSNLIGLTYPMFQAPMAGVSTPAMAAAVTRAGGLGALGLGASTPQAAELAMAEFRALCDGPLHANLFCHAEPQRDEATEADESAVDTAYRARLAAGGQTVMTRAISGRPARCLTNGFTALTEGVDPAEVPDYPVAYDLGKALNAAAKAAGDGRYGAQWSGTGAGRAKALPAGQIMAQLVAELVS